MKELLLSFVLALMVGSVINGYSKSVPATAADIPTSDSTGAVALAAAPINDCTDAAFKADVLQSDIPVLVDFWAEWCAPCKRMVPIIDQLAVQYKGKIKVVRVDADNNPEVAAKFKIQELPTFMFVKDGIAVERYSGIMAKSRLVEAIKSVTAQ